MPLLEFYGKRRKVAERIRNGIIEVTGQCD